MVIISAKVKALTATGLAAVILVPSAFAQTPGNEVAYSDLLQAIAEQKITLAHQQLFVSEQDVKISSLNSQIDGLDDLKATIEPMLGKMAAGITRQVNSDYPFEMDRRIPRLQSLENTLKNPDATVGDKYRKALNVYKLEVNYGQSMESKKGNHPLNPTIRVGDERWVKDEYGEIKKNKKTGLPEEKFDGSYLRYGRLAYVYLQADSSQAMRYDLGTKEWVDLPKKHIADIRRGVKIASGEAAPNVVKVPLFPNP